MNRRQWDIFCKVIDNFGDIGISWRLSAQLAERGQQVRLWVDDASALDWMAPGGKPGVEVLPWAQAAKGSNATKALLASHPGDVLVEAFGCDIPPAFLALWSSQSVTSAFTRCWLNLEYLSAEPYVERSHALPSPVMHGPAAGQTKWFFYPGFSPQTGGLLREQQLMEAMRRFDPTQAEAWLKRHGLRTERNPQHAAGVSPLRVSLLCYEPTALDALLARGAAQGLAGRPVDLLVTAGRSAVAVRAALSRLSLGEGQPDWLNITWLPWLSQTDFDHLLWACDLNFVRGEDSVVRAIWAGKPFVWQIYPQADAAHQPKLGAFLQAINAPASLRAFHAAWNQAPENTARPGRQTLVWPEPAELADWRWHAEQARLGLLSQDDLSTRLLSFVTKNR